MRCRNGAHADPLTVCEARGVAMIGPFARLGGRLDQPPANA